MYININIYIHMYIYVYMNIRIVTLINYHYLLYTYIDIKQGGYDKNVQQYVSIALVFDTTLLPFTRIK